MKVTYDPSVDAVYIYLTKTIREPETRQIDDDIILDFDQAGRLVGIEVLDASRRLDLDVVLSVSKEVKRFSAKFRAKK